MTTIRTAGIARRIAWAAIAVLLIARAVVTMVSNSWATRVIVADSASLLLPLAFVLVGAIAIVSRPGSSDLDRRFWTLLAASTGLTLVAESQFTWHVLVVDSGGPGLWAWSAAFTWSSVILMIILLLTLTDVSGEVFTRRAVVYIDIVSLILVLWPAMYLGVTLPLLASTGAGDALDAAAVAGRALFGLGVVAVCVAVIVGWRGSAWRPWERYVVAGFMLFGLGVAASPVWHVMLDRSGRYDPSWYTDLMGLGLASLCLAIVYRLTATSDELIEPAFRRARIVSSQTLNRYPILVALALPVFVLLIYANRYSPAAGPLEFVGVMLAILLVLRNWFTSLERAQARRDDSTDPSSGAMSPAVFDHVLSAQLDHGATTGREVSLVLFDTSDLRRMADLHGLAAADEMRKRITSVLFAEAAPGVEIIRVGGEGLAAVLPGMGPSEAEAYARRVWLSVVHGSAGGSARGLDLVAGIATFPQHGVEADSLLFSAECAVRAAAASDSEPVGHFDEDCRETSVSERSPRKRMRAFRLTVRALAEAVDARDPATRNHSVNVAELATALAQVLNLPDDRVQLIGLAAMMHDIGKLGITDDILLKDSAFDAAERARIQEHSALGESILAPAQLDDIPAIVRSHHERWDGGGYPDGLAGDLIPLEARILAVCDAYETMTTGRPYAPARTTEAALAEVEACAGSQFDPEVAAVFVRMVRGLGAHRMRQGDPGGVVSEPGDDS